MIQEHVDQQEHGYRNGHQLLSGSLKLSHVDQDAVDRLSDMAGPLRPGETFAPYLTAYPLPSRSHYVISRTWQDLAAPRAGCVLTRSLFVPMIMWETIESLGGLLSLLVPVERGAATGPVVPPRDQRSFPPVEDGRAVELVEAMFLESRQPIVMFEAPEAEAMTVRILTALWPGLRRSFAACTFALAPRKIDGRDFDLAFAPKSARARFADFPGRRIDVNASKTARHRWSEETARQIFKSESPGFAAIDVLGILKNDERGDELALRLVLLWNELSAKADLDPMAVLGLMDILNFSRADVARVFERILPAAGRAVETVSATMPGPEGWRFLGTLVNKLPPGASTERLLEKIRESAADLARRAPEATFRFLASEQLSAENIPVDVLAGAGDGLAAAIGTESSLNWVSGLHAELGLRLFVLSQNFARSLVDAAKREPSSWLSAILRLLQAGDRGIRGHARKQLIPLLDDGVLAPLLPLVLENVRADELAEIAVQIGNHTSFRSASYDEPLANAARDLTSLDELRNAVALHFAGPDADRFLQNTLRLEAADISWLTTLEADRGRRLLVALLEASSDRDILAAQRDQKARERMLSILMGDLTFGAMQAVRILTIGEVEVGQLLEMGQSLLPHLASNDKDRFVKSVVERALTEAQPGEQRVRALVAQLGGIGEPRWLVRTATSRTASSGRIGENLVILDSAPDEVRNGVIAHVDELSDRLVQRGSAHLGEAAYVAWAAMIADAGAVDRNAQLRAGISTLSFALQCQDSPVSAVIVVSFPLVHAQLLKSKGDEDFKLIPALLMLPLSFFVDWDRAKSARRELVNAFLASSWPPADLLLAAINAHTEKAILARLSRSALGQRYMSAIERDCHRLPPLLRDQVGRSLSSFYAHPIGEWDY